MTDDGKGTIRHDDGSLEMFIKGKDGVVLHLTLIPEEETPGVGDHAPLPDGEAPDTWEGHDYMPPPERFQCGYGARDEARRRAEREGR